MTVNVWIHEIHQNAVEHGFWESNRPFYETAALIHSELSEALEEARAGRAMIWYSGEKHKPEGIAVELIDAVIRIFDYIGSKDAVFDAVGTLDFMAEYGAPDEICVGMNVTELIAFTHATVSDAYRAGSTEDRIAALLDAAAGILEWLIFHDVNPENVMLEKHEYNKNREYLHGKKF